jgi:ribonuclease HI
MAAYRQQVRDSDWRSKRVAPLQRLETEAARRVGQIAVQALEKHRPAYVPPWWAPPRIRIAPSREESIKEHDLIARTASDRNMIIYTDGSDIRGHAGGAATTKTHGGWKYRTVYMGKSDQSTVYAAELAGLLLALQIGKDTSNIDTITVFTDNQAAILSAHRPASQSGQWLLNLLVQLLNVIAKQGKRVSIHWIAAHEGVSGNEMTDRLAKEATKAHALSVPHCWKPPMTQLQAACKRVLKQQATEEWEKTWAIATTGQGYRDKFGTAKPPTINKLYTRLPEALAAILIQLRSGNVALASYLNKIKKVPFPNCECGSQANQTVAHIIEECPLFRERRRTELGRPFLRSAVDTLSEPASAKKAAWFMLKIGLLDQFRVVRARLTQSI